MTSISNGTNLADIGAKLDYLEHKLGQDSYSNPIRSNITEIRSDILEFAKVFEEDIQNLNLLLVRKAI
jgi:hypothetical protein